MLSRKWHLLLRWNWSSTRQDNATWVSCLQYPHVRIICEISENTYKLFVPLALKWDELTRWETDHKYPFIFRCNDPHSNICNQKDWLEQYWWVLLFFVIAVMIACLGVMKREKSKNKTEISEQTKTTEEKFELVSF